MAYDSRWTGLARQDYINNPNAYSNLIDPNTYTIDTNALTEQYRNSTNAFGLSKKDNPFSKGNIGGTMKGIGAGVSMIPTNSFTVGDTTMNRGMWDMLDPLYFLGKPKNTNAVGEGFSDAGVGLTKAGLQSGNGWLALAGGISKGIGSLINAGWGGEDKEKTEKNERATNHYGNYTSNAGHWKQLRGPSSVAYGGDAFYGGWFRKGWARRHNKEARQDFNTAVNHAYGSLGNNVNNLKQNDMRNARININAFGGPLGNPFMGYPGDDTNTAVGYDLASYYLTTKKAQADNKGSMGIPNYGGIFASGGKIHINPKNKGKFNATKKRTGKTTEELTHSKNPLTRKRAIFAQNSRKWHRHDYGGYLNNDNLFAEGGDQNINKKDLAKENIENLVWYLGQKVKYPNGRKKTSFEKFLNNDLGISEKYTEPWFGETPTQNILFNNPVVTPSYEEQLENVLNTTGKLVRTVGTETKKNTSKGEPYVPHMRFAFGGDMETNGSDFPTGLMHLDVKESHEENPYGGVKIGEDRNGNPNLLEGGEVVWNEYVFSNRIPIDQSTKDKFHIGKKREMTFADLAKKLEKEIAERPNDPLSKSGFNAQMQTLEEEQERQKQEMEAERAREAFEALPPEEQVAMMDRANQEEQMAQQAMQEQAMAQEAAEQQGMVQPSPEEAAMAQQQMVQEPLPQEQVAVEAPQEMAYGGNLYDEGGHKITPYAYSNNWEGFKYFNPEKNEYTPEYLNFVQNILNQDWINRIMSGQYGDLSRYLARNKGITPTLAQIIALASDKKYSDMHKAVAAAYEDYLRGINPVTGDIMTNGIDTAEPSGVTTTGGYTVNGVVYPTEEEAIAASKDYATNLYNNITNGNVGTQPEASAAPEVPSLTTPPLTGNPIIDELNSGQGKPIRTVVKGGIPTMPIDDSLSERDRASLYNFIMSPEGHETMRKIKEEQTSGSDENISAPKDNWMRYAGLFGPATGLGMMAAGIGKPDYSRLDSALSSLGQPVHASWQPVGSYLTYRPMDIWYEQNRLNANARATDRYIANNAAPVGTKMAGQIANAYNNQLAAGNLFRQALEYNDNKKAQVEGYNRQTDMYNSTAFNQNEQFNAGVDNAYNQAKARLGLAAAQTRLDNDAGWYNSLYGNVASLYKGIGDLGKDKTEKDWLKWLVDRDVFGNTGTTAYGGKINKKKRGFTY